MLMNTIFHLLLMMFNDHAECNALVSSHPNIVDIVTVFMDQVPAVPGDVRLYGEALPSRINPLGYGRNLSLFLVMKKYLASYWMNSNKELRYICLEIYLHKPVVICLEAFFM